MAKLISIILLLTLSYKAFSQTDLGLDARSIKFTVDPDTAWNNLLTRYSGWFGADGIYSIPLNGVEGSNANSNHKCLLIFSDTMIGDIKDGTMQPDYTMIHNSVALLNGSRPSANHIDFFWKKDLNGKPASLFVPSTPQTKSGDYYWLGDGFVNTEGNKALYIFGYRVKNVSSDAFGFREIGNTLIKIDIKNIPLFNKIDQKDTPFFLDEKDGNIGSFGAGIYVNTKGAKAKKADGYIYIYGVRGIEKNLMVSRVLPNDFDNYGKWRFWDGENWIAELDKVSNITSHVSNELSVTQLADGRYALISQVDGMTPVIGLRLANSLTGPWGPIIPLWNCKPDLIKNTYVVYNAKAHPSLSKSNELLVSYNINSVEFIKDLKENPNLYRPRFIRVKFLQ